MKPYRRLFVFLLRFHSLAVLGHVPDLRAASNQQLRDRRDHCQHEWAAQSAGTAQSEYPSQQLPHLLPESIRSL